MDKSPGETSKGSDAVICVSSVVTDFDENRVHDGISFTVYPGSLVALIGGSGTGKTTLLREIIGLLRPTAGSIQLFGEDIRTADAAKLAALRRRFGVLFQDGALFSGLNVGENVALPLRENSQLSNETICDLVSIRLALVGLGQEDAVKMPSELSGGMRKRVGLARALALEPELLFLDEPTSGLDPVNARAFDFLVKTLCRSLKLTVFMVTHDLDSLLGVADRVIVLDQGKVLADGSVAKVSQLNAPWLRSYFGSRDNISQVLSN